MVMLFGVVVFMLVFPLVPAFIGILLLHVTNGLHSITLPLAIIWCIWMWLVAFLLDLPLKFFFGWILIGLRFPAKNLEHYKKIVKYATATAIFFIVTLSYTAVATESVHALLAAAAYIASAHVLSQIFDHHQIISR
ncbi:Uncharacterised protein [Corynebacterium kutscheri]|uniref:Uncharacterized protein n=2 Tax=Corynebacterium kutscheri TaxID=35755 RepID=A0AB38VQK7_9CORY|nr:Uncharacterised protein [Corynebacterium kutscheri]